MDESNISIPVTIHMTCVSCEERRNFEPTKKHPDVTGTIYECRKCGHEAALLLGE